MGYKHVKVDPDTDSPNNQLVRPSGWNDFHRMGATLLLSWGAEDSAGWVDVPSGDVAPYGLNPDQSEEDCDLRYVEEVRLIVNVVSAANSGMAMRAQVFVGAAWVDMSVEDPGHPKVNLTIRGTIDSGWHALDSTTRVDSKIRLRVSGGTGAGARVELGHIFLYGR
jgi:hypothetical protein